MASHRILLTGLLLLAAGALVLFALLPGTEDSTGIRERVTVPFQGAEPGRSLVESGELAAKQRDSSHEVAKREEIGSADYVPMVPRDYVHPSHTVIVGRIVDERREPLSGVSVGLLLTSVEPHFGDPAVTAVWDEREDKTGSNGSFLFEGVSARGYEIILRASARGRPTVQVRCPFPVGGGTTDVGDIVLSKGGLAYGIVIDTAGNPVPHAEIVWRSVDPVANRLVRADGQTHTGVETDEDGRFVVEGLALGRVRFAAVSKGLSCSWTHPYRIAASGDLDEAKELLAELDLLGYEPWGGVTITMKAGLAVRGELIDRDSRLALVGRVSARPHHGDEGSSPTLSATSDADGRFELRGLVPGTKYVLHAHSPGYKQLSHGRSLVVGPKGFSSGWPALWKPIDGSYSLTLALERAEPIQVHVRDGTTLEPIESAELGWVGSFAREPLSPTRLAGVTDSDGNATLAPIEVRAYLHVQAPGYSVDIGRGVQHDGRALYELYRGKRLHINVVDDDGPVGGAIVELRSSWTRKPVPGVPLFEPDNIHMPLIERLVSDRRGRVVFRHLPGRARVLVDAGARGSGITEPLVFDPRSEDDVHVEVRVHPAARLEGVVHLDGEGIRGQDVVAIETLDRGPGITFRTESGEQGRYQLEGLPPGRYFVCARLPSRTPDSYFGFSAYTSVPEWHPVREVELAPGQTIELDLRAEPPEARLSGTLTIDGAPVAGYVILAKLEQPYGRAAPLWMRFDEHSRAGAITDDGGRFDLLHLSPGIWKVAAHRSTDGESAAGNPIGSRTLEVPPGKAIDASITVGTALSGPTDSD